MDKLERYKYQVGSHVRKERMSVADIRSRTKDYYFDARAGNRVCNFFERHIRHMQGPLAGELIQLAPWQRKVLKRAFAWKWKKNGHRVVRTIFIFIPRKNGKSALTSGLGNYMLFGDGEKGAEVVCAAASEDQARQVFRVAKYQVEEDPILRKLSKDKWGKKKTFKSEIEYPTDNGRFKVLSSKAGTKHGANISCVIVDEVHVFESRELIDVLVTGTSARPQPLTIFLTTAGNDVESYCHELYEYSKRLLSGSLEDHSFFPVIYEGIRLEGEPEDWWQSPETWARANPNLNISKFEGYMEQQHKYALMKSEDEMKFKQLDLNLWVRKHYEWLSDDLWDACAANFELEDFKGEKAFLGVDLASNRDLTSVVVIIPKWTGEVGERKNKAERKERYKIFNYYCIPYFWIPRMSLEVRHSSRSQEKLDYLNRWADNGYIRVIDGGKIDYDVIMDCVTEEIASVVKIQEIVADRWQSKHFLTRMGKLGYTTIEMSQGYAAMTSPIKYTENAVIGKELRHPNHPVLNWNRRNTVISSDPSGNRKPDKEKSQEKIDGIVAMITGFARVEQWVEKESVYKGNKFKVL